MANLFSINIQTCDNELYVIASQWAGSVELLHLKSGCNQPVGTTIFPGAILPGGTYDFLFVGIDWGGAVSFTGVLSFDDSTQQPFALTQASGSVYTFDAGQQSVIAP